MFLLIYKDRRGMQDARGNSSCLSRGSLLLADEPGAPDKRQLCATGLDAAAAVVSCSCELVLASVPQTSGDRTRSARASPAGSCCSPSAPLGLQRLLTESAGGDISVVGSLMDFRSGSLPVPQEHSIFITSFL